MHEFLLTHKNAIADGVWVFHFLYVLAWLIGISTLTALSTRELFGGKTGSAAVIWLSSIVVMLALFTIVSDIVFGECVLFKLEHAVRAYGTEQQVALPKGGFVVHQIQKWFGLSISETVVTIGIWLSFLAVVATMFLLLSARLLRWVTAHH